MDVLTTAEQVVGGKVLAGRIGLCCPEEVGSYRMEHNGWMGMK